MATHSQTHSSPSMLKQVLAVKELCSFTAAELRVEGMEWVSEEAIKILSLCLGMEAINKFTVMVAGRGIYSLSDQGLGLLLVANYETIML